MTLYMHYTSFYAMFLHLSIYLSIYQSIYLSIYLCAGTSRGPSVAFDLFPGSTPQLPSEEDFGEFSSFEKEEPPEFCLGIPRREHGWLIRHFLAK